MSTIVQICVWWSLSWMKSHIINIPGVNYFSPLQKCSMARSMGLNTKLDKIGDAGEPGGKESSFIKTCLIICTSFIISLIISLSTLATCSVLYWKKSFSMSILIRYLLFLCFLAFDTISLFLFQGCCFDKAHHTIRQRLRVVFAEFFCYFF